MAVQKVPSALEVADYLLWKAQEEGITLSNKKLQKLLYYCQAWSVTLTNKKAFKGRIEAWIHGPAIKEVYLAFKDFGAAAIKKEITQKMISGISEDRKKAIDSVWKVYSKFDPEYLEYLTHQEEPWLKARHGLEAHISSDIEITPKSMRVYYTKRLSEANKKLKFS